MSKILYTLTFMFLCLFNLYLFETFVYTPCDVDKSAAVLIQQSVPHAIGLFECACHGFKSSPQ